MKTLSHSKLLELLEYDPETGEFTRRTTTGTRWKAGAKAGTVMVGGYVGIEVDGHRYSGHRLAWFYCHGAWPSRCIDHINNIKTDNRLCNLRDVTVSMNLHNRKGAQANNKTGSIGVCFSDGWYYAQLYINGRRVLNNRFKHKDDALFAYHSKRAEHGLPDYAVKA